MEINQKNDAPNPSGKGGFGDHPEHINAGGRPKNQQSFTFWMNYFKNLTTKELFNWELENPEDKRTVAADLAYARIIKSRNQLKEFQEVANRTEGLPRQTIGMDLNGEIKTVLVEFIGDKEDGENENKIS